MPARDGYQNGNSNEQTAEILGYPPALAKACSDIGFSYALGLRSGEVWCFSEAITIDDVWVHIVPDEEPDKELKAKSVPMPFRRGVDVRLSEIVWVADAPYGT